MFKGENPPAIVVMVTAAFLTGTLSGCDVSSEDEHVHCVNDQGVVVNPDLCDDSHYHGAGIWPYYYFMSPNVYPVGSSVVKDNPNWRSTRINPSDPAGRSKAGLPTTGKVGGKTISGGGFGRGGGSTSGGHSSSGHSSSGGHGGGG